MRGHLLLLVLFVLCPLSATAGQVQEYTIQKDQPVVHCRIYQDEYLGPVMEGPGCNKHLLPSCYQRMQEAMRAMGEAVESSRRNMILQQGVAVRRGGKLLIEVYTTETLRKWDNTMRDCVKGE